MTPNEIKKRLQYFSEAKCKFCIMKECKDKETVCNTCIIKCIDYILNLLNQYEAEIESLEVEKLHLTEFLAESERNVKDLEVGIKALRGAANSYKLELEHARAEIESLNNQERILICQLAEEREKAIRDFAERLKETFPNNSHWIRPREKVDNLVEEMEKMEDGRKDTSI